MIHDFELKAWGKGAILGMVQISGDDLFGVLELPTRSAKSKIPTFERVDLFPF